MNTSPFPNATDLSDRYALRLNRAHRRLSQRKKHRAPVPLRVCRANGKGFTMRLSDIPESQRPYFDECWFALRWSPSGLPIRLEQWPK
jgi:hypothetical protein